MLRNCCCRKSCVGFFWLREWLEVLGTLLWFYLWDRWKGERDGCLVWGYAELAKRKWLRLAVGLFLEDMEVAVVEKE